MAPCQSRQRQWVVAGVIILSVLSPLLFATAPCTAQEQQQEASDGEEPGQLSSAEVLSQVALYLGVTVVCVAVFSLVFLKCWHDVSRALEDPERPVAEPPAEDAGPAT